MAAKSSTKTKKKKTKTPPVQTESTLPKTPPKDSNNNPSASTPKRTKSPGVRVVGNRIYDSKNGKTCHQCRQKTMDFVASCTHQMDNKKQCTLNVCRSCLLNRYGENAEEAVALGDWKCPRCRGICNCSFCMKKRGCGPTGMLIHTAKKNGFASVSNLLNMNGTAGTKKSEGRKKRKASEKETTDEPKRKRSKEDDVKNEMKEDDVENEVKEEDGDVNELNEEDDDKNEVNDEDNGENEVKGEEDGENEDEKDIEDDEKVEIELPEGTELTNVDGIDMPSGDIGHALQLLEFCETFGEVLELKKGEPEILLRELNCANTNKRREVLIVKFHVRLLSIIEEDLGKKYSGKSWLEDFKECISESMYTLKDSLLEWFNDGYDEMNFSKKLRLLNFLCDETLETAKLRLWIEEQNLVEKKKIKEKLIANREKEKNMKKKVQDEVAKAILSRSGIPLSLAEHNKLISKVKAETAQTLANSLELREVPHQSFVVRSEPILLDRKGCKLWRLRCHADTIGILVQDSCYGDEITSDENWFTYNDQEKEL
ncbi:uncharacterized protein [Rutidosis leptorrhynchoides]|uniref:uncharacterized protein n=1 Tax=Rutidosis leptorrhynchoides TaxID=125765 RepID=UPI003A99B07B